MKENAASHDYFLEDGDCKFQCGVCSNADSSQAPIPACYKRIDVDDFVRMSFEAYDDEDAKGDTFDEDDGVVDYSSNEDERRGVLNDDDKMAALQMQGEQDDAARMKRVERIFTSQKLKRSEQIGATEKRTAIHNLVCDNDVEAVLSGSRLERGQEIFRKLRKAAKQKSFKSVTITGLASSTMTLSKLVHEEHCKDEQCPHCCATDSTSDEEEGDRPALNDAATAFKKLYELSSEYELERQDIDDVQESSGTGDKTAQRRRNKLKALFTPTNCPREMTFLPSMVSLFYLHRANSSSSSFIN